MKTDEDLAIIEIIDDDVDPFGDRATNTTIYDTGGPRWIGPVAAAALIALMTYGVATSATSNSAPKVAPVTTIEHAPTTTQPKPTPTTTVPPPLVPYYAADPPPEYSLDSAQIEDESGVIFSRPPGNYQLWATSGSEAWFSIVTYSGGGLGYAVDAYRVRSGAQSIAISHTPSGQTLTQFAHGGSVGVTITSSGWSDADLIMLASSVTADQRAIHFNDRSLLADYQMLSSVQPWLAVQGNPVEYVNYSSGRDLTGGITLTVAPRPPSGQGGDTRDRQVALYYFFDQATTFDADGHVAVAGTLVGQPDAALASWIAGEHIVTISGSLPLQQLVTIAQTVHEVTADEWRGMQFQAASHSSNNDFGNPTQSLPAPVSFGNDGAAEPWKIEVMIGTFANRQFVNWQWDNSGFGSSAEETATINTVVDAQRTYVLADLPRAVAATAQLQINRAGLDPVLVPFNDAQPTSDRTFAAYAFSEPTTYTAQIIGADGAVLASWPSG
ncbi:MAG: hypothetical protein JJD93_18995 [Ilumatobacteraceae bacterium]|nr:hypothetical protein [Ilumatobacteraceae bacterium]